MTLACKRQGAGRSARAPTVDKVKRPTRPAVTEYQAEPILWYDPCVVGPSLRPGFDLQRTHQARTKAFANFVVIYSDHMVTCEGQPRDMTWNGSSTPSINR